MAMSAETKALILQNWNAGSSMDAIARALRGRYSRSAISGVIHRARLAGAEVRRDRDQAGPRGRAAAVEMKVVVGPEVWGWLERLAADAARHGDARGAQALAASMLAELARDDAAAEAA